MKRMIIAAIAALVPSLAVAGQWAYVGSDDTAHFAVDIGTIRVEGDRRTFWHVTAYQEAQEFEGQGHDYSVNQAIITCQNSAISSMALTYYNLSASSPIFSETYDAPDFNPIIPDTVGYALWEFVCGHVEWPEETIETARVFTQSARLVYQNQEEWVGEADRAAERAAEPID